MSLTIQKDERCMDVATYPNEITDIISARFILIAVNDTCFA